ncbi:MAG TPA: NADH-ubiquinone oxidoreductase-F iron-sulfur binding region domain-containing protein, partial [Gaiellaceae bacterium]|nr:NADH-ubiquinone oxidoreductase-F iron-sulfur binding region domain-containing protein [Gaiellaceae bacterium]
LVDAVLRIAEFFRDESCGQCVPCRVGTIRQEEALHRLAGGRANGNELEVLADLTQVMRDASICGLGQTAANAVASAMTNLGVLAS